MKRNEERAEEEVKLCRYRWEFLRRNEEYCQYYRAYSANPKKFEEINYPNLPLAVAIYTGWKNFNNQTA